MRAPLILAAAVLLGAAIGAAPADASCKRFGFTVNDYGKDGPTKDAKELLDKHIAEWAAEQKIKDYKTGAKSVNCELFLNFVVFDEHTCTASANVCWNDGKGGSTPDATAEEAEAGIPPTPIRKAALAGHDKTMAAAKTPPAATETPPASPPTDTAAAATPPEAPPAATEFYSAGSTGQGRRDGAAASARQGRGSDAVASAGPSRRRGDGHAAERPAHGAQEACRRRSGGCSCKKRGGRP